MKRLLIVTQKIDSSDQLLGFFLSWVRAFAEHFSHVTVLCLEHQSGVLPENVRVISLGKDRGASKVMQVLAFYSNSIALRSQYDAVFVHMNPIWAVLGAALWRLLGKRVCLWYTHKAVTLKLRIAHALVHTVFTASAESFRIPSRKRIVTGHGIDTDMFSPDGSVTREPQSLLTVGRIAPVKNYAVLLDAVRILRDEGLRIPLAIAGEPALTRDVAYLKELQRFVAENDLDGQVAFLGKKQGDALVREYRSHGLFVHMSRTGSLDKAILEAMACGMNVISCNDASRGFLPAEHLFDGDSPSALAHAIRTMLGAPAPAAFREYVVQSHSLRSLIRHLSEVLSHDA